MSKRSFAQTFGLQNAIWLALVLAVPAAHSQTAANDATIGVGNANKALPNTANPPSATPTMDPRARDAWLRECRRRMSYTYDYGEGRKAKKPKRGDPPRESGYDYCEAYFDDYYRSATPPLATTPSPTPTAVQTPVAGQVQEVITEYYVRVPNRKAQPRKRTRSTRSTATRRAKRTGTR